MSWNSPIDLGAPSGRAEGLCSSSVWDRSADVLEHRWVIILHSGVQFWPGICLSPLGNGWVTCIKSWNCPHLSTLLLMWKNDSGTMDGSWLLLQWRYFICWTKARFWQGNQWDKLWAMVLAPRGNVFWLVNDQPRKYETSFDNLNFWKQFRGQVGSLQLPRKGKFFSLLRCCFFFSFATCTHKQCWPMENVINPQKSTW